MALRDWLELSRAEHALLTFFAVLLGWAVASRGVGLLAVAAGVGPALVTLGAFVLNDYFDVATDRVMGRFDRPLVSGRIRQRVAFWAGCLLLALGVVASLPFGNAFFITLFFAGAAVAYNAFLKKLPLAGNVFIALSMAVPFFYGNVASGAPLSALAALFSAIAFVVGLGRELFITSRDVEGDRSVGAATLPMLAGVGTTTAVASLLFALGVFLSVLPFNYGAGALYAVLAGVCDALLAYCIFIGLRKPGKRGFAAIRNYSLAALGFGLAAFATLAL